MKDLLNNEQNRNNLALNSKMELVHVNETESASRSFFVIKTNKSNEDEIDQTLIDFYLN